MANDIEMPLIPTPPSEESPPVPKQPFWLRFLHWTGERIRSKPHLFAFFLYILSLVVISCIFWKTNEMDLDSRAQWYDGSGVILFGYAWQVDPNLQSLSIRWEIWGCGEYNADGFPICYIGCDRAMDVYFDGSPTPIFSYQKPKYSIYQTSKNTSSFSMDHKMEGYTQSFAPFDFYYLDVVVSVVDKTSGENVSILGIVTGSQVQNFNVFSASDGDLTDIYDPVTGLTPVEGKPHVAFIEVRRSTLARVFTICLLIINWALTSVSAWVTIIVYFRKEKPGDAVLLFPLTLVVTIPALRKLYIGSPPYGILIDMIGFYTQMMVVGVCSVFLFWVGARSTVLDRPDQSGPVQMKATPADREVQTAG